MLPEQQRSPKPPFNTEAAPLIFQYSHLFTGCLLRASWVNECKAFHLVGVCQRPSAVASVLWTPSLRALLIEPDQFTETASRLAELPHQRDSNNSALWPLHRRGEKKKKKKKNVFVFTSKQERLDCDITSTPSFCSFSPFLSNLQNKKIN